MKRISFLRLLGAGLGSLPFTSLSKSKQLDRIEPLLHKQGTGKNIGLAHKPIATVRIGIIGMGNRGKSLLQMLDHMLEEKQAVVIAMSDLRADKTDWGTTYLKDKQAKTPECYSGSEYAWQQMADRDDIDLLVIATPWEWHLPMALYGMEHQKHVAVEVPLTYSLEGAWQLIETAERTGMHCMLLENCCYNGEELWLLRMAQEGVFGELTHAECAYNHDLRAYMLHDTMYENHWRLKHHAERNGNLYPTHGLGPVSFYFGIGRGDQMNTLVSMSSKEAALSAGVKEKGWPYPSIVNGDMNNTLIRTHQGRTILLQFNTHTGQPYSRINMLGGTKAVHRGYPSKLYIDQGPFNFQHEWLGEEDYREYREKYEHPLWKQLQELSQQKKQGHGGMDFVMMYRLIRCLNLGLPLDIDLYESVLWSAITPLSAWSVANGSQPINIPDFTGGRWKEERALEINRDIS